MILAPVVAVATAAGDDSGPIDATFDLSDDSAIVDVFGEMAPMNTTAMSAASGGTNTAIDIDTNVNIDDIAMNDSTSQGIVRDVSNENTVNGQITDNSITANTGITTIFNNTGNGVVMQSTVNVNVFMD
ncbi:MAG: hypothetical protein AAF224_01480 [Pseudomonadota bacterium]